VHDALQDSRVARDAHSGIGYSALKQNHLEEAKREFNQVLSVNPGDPAALVGLAIVRNRPRQDANAARYLEKSLASGPPNAEAEGILRKILLKERVSGTTTHMDRGEILGRPNWLKAGAKPGQTTPEAMPTATKHCNLCL